MRYRLVEKQTTYQDTPHNDSWMGTLNFYVEDENGKIVTEYRAQFHYLDDYTHCYTEAGEGYCIHTFVSEEEAWAKVVLGALNKWQPLDYDYNYFYKNRSYFHKPIFKNKSPLECAELYLRQKQQEIEQEKAQRKQQISQRKIEAARWEAEREEAKKLKELQQKQEEAARLEGIKQYEAARLQHEQRVSELKKIIQSITIFIVILCTIYGIDLYRYIRSHPIEISSFLTGCRFTYFLGTMLMDHITDIREWDLDRTITFWIRPSIFGFPLFFGGLLSLIIGVFLTPFQYFLVVDILYKGIPLNMGFFSIGFLGNPDLMIAGSVVGFIIGSLAAIKGRGDFNRIEILFTWHG